ncbi:MAG: SDR family NAD(P)-dependent oxidoreductase [Haloarculaceae archaeon]
MLDGTTAIVTGGSSGIGRAIVERYLDEWKQVLDVDLDGVMPGMKAALPHLEESGGCIVTVASIDRLVGGKGAASYSAAKGGVVNLTQQVAIDYAERGVRVNSICPGFVDTPMAAFLASDDASYVTGANVPVDGGWAAH